MPEFPTSVLIVRLSAIGDVVHSLPVLEEIRRQLPSARIGWIVEGLSAPLLEDHPMIDKLYTIPKKRWRKDKKAGWREGRAFFRSVRSDGWETAVDLQGLSKSALAARFSGANHRVGFRGANAKEISGLVNNMRILPHDSDVHVVQQNLRLLEGLGLNVPGSRPVGCLGLSDDEKDQMRVRLRKCGWGGEPMVALNPGAGWETKRWPPSYYGELGSLINGQSGLRPLVLWGPGEESQRDEIAETLSDLNPVIAPKTSVRELAVLISLVSLFVGGDTGASHLCGPLRVPVLSIWGGSDPLRNRPWTIEEGVPLGFYAQASELGCVPCWETKCPLPAAQRLGCLSALTPLKVMEQASTWIDRVLSRT